MAKVGCLQLMIPVFPKLTSIQNTQAKSNWHMPGQKSGETEDLKKYNMRWKTTTWNDETEKKKGDTDTGMKLREKGKENNLWGGWLCIKYNQKDKNYPRDAKNTKEQNNKTIKIWNCQRKKREKERTNVTNEIKADWENGKCIHECKGFFNVEGSFLFIWCPSSPLSVFLCLRKTHVSILSHVSLQCNACPSFSGRPFCSHSISLHFSLNWTEFLSIMRKLGAL